MDSRCWHTINPHVAMLHWEFMPDLNPSSKSRELLGGRKKV